MKNNNNNPFAHCHHSAPTSPNYNDTYQIVTDYVIAALERGEVIWKKGWNTLGFPKNVTTGKTYKGWNLFFLNFITLYHYYATPYFITFKQAAEKGGRIKKGAKGIPVIYWATVEDKNRTRVIKDVASGQDKEEPLTHLIPKTHIVFNIDATEGIAYPEVERLFRTDSEKIASCEAVVDGMPLRPVIEHKGDRAYYCSITDKVTMPRKELFIRDESYYTTLFHELAHSTGHPSRLNRIELVQSDGFEKDSYSKEELTAELAAAYVSAIGGIEQVTIENSAAYMKGWLKALQDDKTMVIKAAAAAQAAADYILKAYLPAAA